MFGHFNPATFLRQHRVDVGTSVARCCYSDISSIWPGNTVILVDADNCIYPADPCVLLGFPSSDIVSSSYDNAGRTDLRTGFHILRTCDNQTWCSLVDRLHDGTAVLLHRFEGTQTTLFNASGGYRTIRQDAHGPVYKMTLHLQSHGDIFVRSY